MITILFLSANPTNTQPLELIKECNKIEEEIRYAAGTDKFDFRQRHDISLEDLRKQVLVHNPQIIHFSGHGSPRSELVFKNQDGNMEIVPSTALSKLFEILSEDISLVFLNACYSEEQARAIAKHVDYVIGMSREISDEAAILFSVSFYSSLGFGKSVEDSFNLAKVDLELFSIPEEATPRLLVKEGTSPSKTINKTSPVLEHLPPAPQPTETNVESRRLTFTGEKGLFIGRKDYLETSIKNAVKDPGSRVSLVGPGGSGKSQLAFKALHQYYENDKIIDLVVPVYLAPYSLIEIRVDGSTDIITNITFRKFLNDIGTYLITNRISSLTKQQFEELDTNECKKTIFEVFSNKKHPVLYCDNFETISLSEKDKKNLSKEKIQDINYIFNFLNNEVPDNTSILVTSRNANNYLVGENKKDLSGLEIEEGVKLFIEYASAYRKNLENKNNKKLQDLLKQIVIRTGGHPLSIEILAKTYKGNGTSELEGILDTLGNERKDPFATEERLESLHNSLKYSIDKLDSNSKQILPLLTIFHSPFPPRAVREIFQTEELIDLLSLPSDLYNKSLLIRIEEDRYGQLDDMFWLYTFHPAIRNHLEERSIDDVSKKKNDINFIERYYRYCSDILEGICNVWGTDTENHTNFMRRFNLMTATESKNDFDNAIEFAECFENYDKKQEEKLKLASAEIASFLGSIYQNLGLYDKALPYFSKALEIYEKFNDIYKMATEYGNIGMVYNYKGRYEDALSYHNKSLEIHKGYKNNLGNYTDYASVEIAKDYGNIGTVYYYMGQYKDALTYYDKALEMHEKLNNSVGMAGVHYYIGRAYSGRILQHDALTHLGKALEMHEKLNNSAGMAKDYNYIGVIYYYKEHYDDALTNLNKALKISEGLNDKVGIVRAYKNLADVYFTKNDKNKTMEALDRALVVANDFERDTGTVHPLKDLVDRILKNVKEYYNRV